MTLRVRPKLLRRLLPPGSRVLVATSGGADSQALLHLLASRRQHLEIEVHAVGIDHQLRSDAAGELDIAEALAQTVDVPFTRIAVSVPTDGNLMANARRTRHRAIADTARRTESTRIALGHTATDVAETVLLNLARGSSLRGAGALPARRGRVVRPLVDFTREEVRAYCAAHGLPFADDPTNSDLNFRRPLVRHAILPALRAVSNDAERAILRFARDARAAERSLHGQASGFIACHRVQHGPWPGAPAALPASRLKTLDPALRTHTVREFLELNGASVNRRRLNRILGALNRSDFIARWHGVIVGVDRGHLFVVHAPGYRANLVDGWVLPPWGARFFVSEEDHRADAELPNAATGVAFDAERLHLPLMVRSWARGDEIRCFGHGGRSKVGDLFTNAKIPKPLRQVWPVVTHGEDVVWVPGLKRSSLAPVTNTTRKTLVIELDAALMEYAY